MNSDQLLFQVGAGLENAHRLTTEAWDNKTLTHPNAIKLRDALSSALSAAQELERRAAGVPPPKIGD